PDLGWSAERSNDKIEFPVAIEIGNRAPAMAAWGQSGEAGFLRERRPRALQVAKHSVGLADTNAVLHVGRCNVSAADEDILPTVVVKVGNIDAVARHRTTERGHFAARRDLLKRSSRHILINGESLVLQGSQGYVRIAVVFQIAKIAAHTGDQVAVLRQCDSRLEGHLFETVVPLIVIEEVEKLVVGHEDVGEAVVVIVGDGRRHTLSGMRADASLLGDVGESSLAVVQKQLAWSFLVELWVAVFWLPLVFAVGFAGAIPRKIIHDE